MSADIENRVVDLETRLTHLAVSLDNLTAASVHQGRVIEELLAQLEQIKQLLQQTSEPTAMPESEPPPPHY